MPGARSNPTTAGPAAARWAVVCPGPQPTSATGPAPASSATRVQQPPVERLRRPARRRTARRSARGHLVVAGAAPARRARAGPSRSTTSRSTAGSAAASATGCGSGPSRCAQRGSCCPGCRGSCRTSGNGCVGQLTQAGLDLVAVARTGAAARPGTAARPGACGPRSNSSVSRARWSAASPSRSSSRWWYLSTREPAPAHTARIRPRSLSRASRPARCGRRSRPPGRGCWTGCTPCAARSG